MHVYLQCLSFSTISKWQQFNSNLIVKKRTRSQSSIATKRGSMVQSYCQGKLTVWLRFTQTTLWISSATTRMLWVISKSEASHVDLNRADSSTESYYPCTSLRGITTEQYQLGVVHKYMRKMTNVKISQIWSRLGQFLIHDVSPSTIMMSGCMPGVNKTSTHWSISPGSMARRLECHSNWIYPVDGGKEREDVKSSKQTSCHWPTTHTDGWKRAED